MAESQSTVLDSLVAQVRGMMFYGFQMYGAREGEQVVHPPFPLQWRSSCIGLVVRRTGCGSVRSPRLSSRIHSSLANS